MNPIITADHINYIAGGNSILKDISFEIYPGAALAIVGPSGSGKTTLGKIISGHIPISSGILNFNLPSISKRILISQQHDFREHSSRSYYQQRYDSNYGEESPKVKDELLKLWNSKSEDKNNFETKLNNLSLLLRIDYILESRLIELSNGEGKRVQLAKALLQDPHIIVFDNPFIGLDTNARKTLHEIIDQLILTGIIVFIITTPDEIPNKITNVIELEHGEIKYNCKKSDFNNHHCKDYSIESVEFNTELLKDIIIDNENDFSIAIEMKEVSVSYGEKKILDNINWKVVKGDCWALLGSNGAGKSTLLSLINGDNPQAYKNDIILFDHKKGEGESIWDIKRKIGYISPELHIFYQRNPSFTETLSLNSQISNTSYSPYGTTIHEAISSGFNDQVGSSQKISSFQKRQVALWIEALGLEKIKNQPLASTSLGNQRLALLGRAIVKNPPLLILDEPCQGLDKEQTKRFTNIVDIVCKEFNKTLIYVSHYSEDIPKCVTKMLKLEKGKVVDKNF